MHTVKQIHRGEGDPLHRTPPYPTPPPPPQRNTKGRSAWPPAQKGPHRPTNITGLTRMSSSAVGGRPLFSLQENTNSPNIPAGSSSSCSPATTAEH